MTETDFLLRRYSAIILDEAHERSFNIDILVELLSRVIKLREKLYLEQQQRIRSGVKIDLEMMITQLKPNFEDEFDEASEKTGDVLLDLLNDSASLSALKASFEAFSKKPCKENTSAQEDSESLKKRRFRERKVKPIMPIGPLHVLPLYAMLPTSAQDLVFKEVPEGERLVVVATNVAETSLTIPGIKYVIDSGKEKVKLYNFANGMESYEVQWISKASAAQRAGRAGRTGPGHCYRLYSSAAYSKDDLFPKFKCPEISKIPVDGVVLFMKSIGIDKVANFPFPTPPEPKAITEAENCLKVLEALDSQNKLTQIGRAMAQYPMSPRHSRMLLTVFQSANNQKSYPRANLLLAYAIATVSALSFPNPCNHTQFDTGSSNQGQESKRSLKKAKFTVKEARKKFINPSSDALTFAHALHLFERAENKHEFCEAHGLHHKTMQDMSKLRAQLLKLVFFQCKFSEEFRWSHGGAEEVEKAWKADYITNPLQVNEEGILCQAVCAGWADRVAKRVRKVSEKDEVKTRAVRYQSCALDETVYLHRWSSLSNSAPEFVAYTELLETNRPYMHGATGVKSNWLVKYGSSLCSFSAPVVDPKPYYDPLTDRALCWVTPLFGRHNWELSLYSLPVEDAELRVSVFASALLEGSVLPCVRMEQKCLAMPASTLLKKEGLGQKRVGDLLNALRMGSETIDSRENLREAWSENPLFLYPEIKNWFQGKYHDRFEKLWKEMLLEVGKDGKELFPKKAKMDRKKAK